jgi:hypothetical protein
MNWKNVYYLMQISRKSGRLLRGINTTKFKDNKIFAFLSYGLPIGIGLVAGFFAWSMTNILSDVVGEMQSVIAGVFVSLPTFVLVATAVLTLLFQLQRSGVKLQTETPYWLPITWQEHTLASILASLLGLPLSLVILLSSAILTFSVLSGGLIALAITTSIIMFAAAFLSSVLMEILRVLQTRFTGAIYKSSGRGAIWVRFAGSIAFLLIFFVLYLSFIYGSVNFISTMANVQSSIFFVPFVWLGLVLSSFFLENNAILGTVYMVLSVAFIGSMYALAVLLNKRFGLYEPPTIKIQKSGVYTPKTGLLGKFGFLTTEAAIIRKDFKAFTRRKELISVFITPVIFMLIPLLQSFSMASAADEAVFSGLLINVGMAYLFPASFMVFFIGSFMIGQEGPAIWRIYASPISAKGLVKSKYCFAIFFGLIMLAITAVVGMILYNVSTTMMIVGVLEALFLLIAVSAVSLYFGFIGADFTEVPRPRMMRQSWMLLCMVVCAVIGLVIIAPLIPTVISAMGIFDFNLSLNTYVAVAISGIIASIIAVVFHKLTLTYAKDFLRKAEI